MALALRGAVQKGPGGSPLSLSNPSGLAVNDLVIGIYAAFSAPTLGTGGLASFGSGTDSGGFLYTLGRKVATGSETTFELTFGAGRANGILFAVTGGDTTTLTESYSATNFASNTTFTAPAATPTADNCWHVIAFEDTNNSNTVSTPPAGYTQLELSDDSGNTTLVAYYKDLGAASSGVSTGTTALVWGSAAFGAAHSFILRAAAGGGGSCLHDSDWSPADQQASPLTIGLWG